MAKTVTEHTAWYQGISDFPKQGGDASYRNGRSIDHRSDSRSIKLLPRTIKESATTVVDLPKWASTPPNSNGDTYLYGNAGNIYKRTSAGVHTNIHTTPSSHGNGMSWFGEDNFIYYTNDTTVGRYGPLTSATPQFNDDFFGSQGGTRTNTNSLELNKASSQYAYRASTASLQVAGDLSIVAKIYPYSLPTTGETQTIVSKWDESGATRGYKFDIGVSSNYFGDGSDGALTISTNTTDAPIDSACSGTSGTNTLSATNASFSVGQVILIHQTQGTSAGTWMRTKISGYTAGTITTEDLLNFSYNTGAQVLVLKQYTNVTVNSGITWTAKAWNGTVGGILGFLANGTVTITGNIFADGKGYRGGSTTFAPAFQGEGTAGIGVASASPNGNGGGGSGHPDQSGAGGGNGTQGSNNLLGWAYGGNTAGSNDLTTMVFGGGGGGGEGSGSSSGGNGGGIIFISGVTIVVTGSITSNGLASALPSGEGSGGAGAGGSILIKSQTATLGSNLIIANGGASTPELPPLTDRSGAGGYGRIHIDYYSSYTGTTTPTITALQDNNLGSSNGNVLRLALSDDGTDSETLSVPITLQINKWQQVSVSWDASASEAKFYLDGVLLGTQTGAMTSIDANASAFYVGSYKNATVVTGFYDGLIDEVMVFGITRTNVDFLLMLNDSILTTTNGLKAYYNFNAVATDSTSFGNDLTLSGSPTYSTNTPFIGPSTRLDIDQSATTVGNTYTVPLTITESATTIKTFTPEKDPQKSISVLIASVGTGDWTLTVHDQYQNEIASKTVVNASLATGYFEFIFASEWRPLLNETYHFHLTSTVADGTVTTTNAGELSTVSFRTYFQFLVTDTQYHPVAPFLQFLVFGNERYVGTLEATLYEPNTISLTAGWKVRCFGYWNEYLAIGAWKGDTVSEYDQGRIFFWDGVSDTYNFFIDIPEGAVNAMIGTRGKLYFIAGYKGRLMVYEGGSSARKIKNLLNTESNTTIDIYPGAMTMWRALLRIGCAGNADDDSIQRGVYTWGSVNEQFPDSLSFDHPISTGNYVGNNVRIGLTHVVNGKLLIGWQDTLAYGIDYVDISNAVYPTGTVEHLINDEGAMYHEKEVMTLVTHFDPLVSGQSVALKYRLNRNSSWTELPAVSTVGMTLARATISANGQRYREYEVGANLATTVASSPTVYSIGVERDMLEKEKRV